MLISILSVDWCYLLLSFCCLVLHAIAYRFFLSTCVACYCLLFLSINLCCLLFLKFLSADWYFLQLLTNCLLLLTVSFCCPLLLLFVLRQLVLLTNIYFFLLTGIARNCLLFFLSTGATCYCLLFLSVDWCFLQLLSSYHNFFWLNNVICYRLAFLLTGVT